MLKHVGSQLGDIGGGYRVFRDTQRKLNVLIRLSTPELLLRLAREVVDEKGADCTAAVIGPGCVARRVRASWHARVTEGRAGVRDMGIRNTFARDARAGDKDRIVVGVYGGCGRGYCAGVQGE